MANVPAPLSDVGTYVSEEADLTPLIICGNCPDRVGDVLHQVTPLIFTTSSNQELGFINPFVWMLMGIRNGTCTRLGS